MTATIQPGDHRVLLVRLPCNPIFPVGPIYLADHLHKQFPGMAPISQRAIDDKLSRPGCESCQDFGDHDRPMGSSGGPAASDDSSDILSVAFRLMLFVLLAKLTGMSATVTRASFRLVRN